MKAIEIITTNITGVIKDILEKIKLTWLLNSSIIDLTTS
jgi:hypothetical protein